MNLNVLCSGIMRVVGVVMQFVTSMNLHALICSKKEHVISKPVICRELHG